MVKYIFFLLSKYRKKTFLLLFGIPLFLQDIFNSFSFGLLGRFSKPPPQFGQTFSKTDVTHSTQKVHSKVQIIASVRSLGNDLPQFSQIGLISSIIIVQV